MRRRKSNRSSLILVVVTCLGALLVYWQMAKLIQGDAAPLATFRQSQTDFAKKANAEIKDAGETTPLILQTDERWSKSNYGYGQKDNTMGTNGCAIASLTMMLSFLDNKQHTPDELLDWAGNDYYVPEAGTSWDIFPAFAANYGYGYEGLTDLAAMQERLNAGVPLIVSVKPGSFTTTGHIMFVKAAAADATKLRVFDPNDGPKKNHYQKLYTPQEVLGQVVQAWAFA